MALILRGKSTCAVCDRVLAEGEAIVATSHFIADQNDRLWKYSDAAMHRACFVAWPDRLEFVDRYNSSIGQIVWGNGTSHHMEHDGTIVSRPAR